MKHPIRVSALGKTFNLFTAKKRIIKIGKWLVANYPFSITRRMFQTNPLVQPTIDIRAAFPISKLQIK